MIISEFISKKYTSALVNNNLISKADYLPYKFCIEYSLDLILFNLSIIIIGLFTNNFINSIIFVLSMVPLKMISGGAHANSAGVCSFISYCTYFLAMHISSLFSISDSIKLVLAFPILIGIIILTPVDHPNKRFSSRQKSVLKKCCCIYSSFIFVIIQIMIRLDTNPKYANTILISILVVFINQIIGILIDSRRKQYATKHCDL